MKGLMLKYFVLNPNKQDVYGKASRFAIKEYARIIKSKNKILAKDLEVWISTIETKIIENQI